jgi:hypothetical protein
MKKIILIIFLLNCFITINAQQKQEEVDTQSAINFFKQHPKLK